MTQLRTIAWETLRPRSPGFSPVGVWIQLACAAWLLSFASTTAQAQWPNARLTSIFPAGGSPGAAVEVTISGSDLDDASQLVFSHPGITAKSVMADPMPFESSPQSVPNRFVVQVAADVPVGQYEARAIGKYGASSPRFFQIDPRKSVLEVEPNNELEQAQEVPLDSIVDGRAEARGFDCFKVAVKQGQRVIVDCHAARLDSRMDPTLSVYDPTGRELGRIRDTNREDPLFDFTAATDGFYTVKVYDFLYGGGETHFYRLAIGTAPYIDFVLPPAAVAGGPAKVMVYGRNLPGGQTVEGLSIDGRPIERMELTIEAPKGPAELSLAATTMVAPTDAFIDGFECRVTGTSGVSNPARIGFAAAPVSVEIEPNNDPAKAQTIQVPCEIAGQFYPRGDSDWFVFTAAKGDTYTIEVFSQRLGLKTDPQLIVEQVMPEANGEVKTKELEAVDDQGNNLGGIWFYTATDDPAYRFVAPADGSYRVMVRDLYGSSRGDPRFVYRLAIRPEQPDFRVLAMPRAPKSQNNQTYDMYSPQVRRGGTAWLDVLVIRNDRFEGAIEVTAQGLPPGVACPTITINNDQPTGTLVFKAADDAAQWSGPLTFVAKSKIGDQVVERPVRFGDVIWPGSQNQGPGRSRMTDNLFFSVIGQEVAPFLIELDSSRPWEMARAGKLEIPIKITRRNNFGGQFQFTQVMWPKSIQFRNFNIDGKATEGKLEIALKNNTELGPFTVVIQGATQLSYARNPEAVEEAKAKAQEVAKFVAEATDAAKKADAERQAADKALAEAKAKLKAAQDELAKAVQAAQKDPANPQSTEAKAAAEKKQAEAEAAVKAAEEAKAAADKKNAEAAAMAKKATDLKQAADKRMQDTANAAKPKNINLVEVSTPVTIVVTPAPIKLDAIAPPPAIKAGAKTEYAVKVERLYGFEDPIELNLELPKNAGVTIAKVTIPKGQSEAKFTLDAGDKAQPGMYEGSINATLNFNGQGLAIEQPVSVTVEAKPAS